MVEQRLKNIAGPFWCAEAIVCRLASLQLSGIAVALTELSLSCLLSHVLSSAISEVKWRVEKYMPDKERILSVCMMIQRMKLWMWVAKLEVI